MSDLKKWNVHGPVRTLQSEFAEWDLSREEWQPSRRTGVFEFRPDGKISASVHDNPDGSVMRSEWLYDDAGRLVELQHGDTSCRWLYSYDSAGRPTRTMQVNQDGSRQQTGACTYDDAGRKTKVQYLAPELRGVAHSYGVEGTGRSYAAPGATTVTINYDERDLPAEVLFHDAHRRLVRRVAFVRDEAGKLLSEEYCLGDEPQFPGLPDTAMANIFGPGRTLSSTTYAYDSQGRLSEKTTHMGVLGEDHTTFQYDDHENPIEQGEEHHSREFGIDENGTMLPTTERAHTRHIRFEYRYDAQGNWTERVVWIRQEPNPNFERSNIERREIGYYTV